MNYEVKTTKNLIADNGNSFSVGFEILFIKDNKRYIGNIEEINDDNIVISQIEVDGENISGTMTILLSDIVENSCHHVHPNWD